MTVEDVSPRALSDVKSSGEWDREEIKLPWFQFFGQINHGGRGLETSNLGDLREAWLVRQGFFRGPFGTSFV